jgi:GT2 family glycosyltransferase
MIFVGNNPPTEFVGSNFRYIYSEVKPSQCIEIGAREARGEYIMPVNDDNVFSENFIDNIDKEIGELDTSKYLLSFIAYPSYFEGETPREWKRGIVKTANYYGVEVGECTCFPRNLWEDLGGIDKKFIHTWFDLDLLFRGYEYGLNLRLSKSGHIREIIPKLSAEEADLYNKNSLFRRYERYHISLLDFLWLRWGFQVSKKRLCPVESFYDKDIMTVSQGEKGCWK